jgi:hypothetical protein
MLCTAQLCSDALTSVQDEYRFRAGLQTHAAPVRQPTQPVTGHARRRRRLPKKTVVVIATSPLWVPMLPLLLPLAGAYWLGMKAHDNIKQRRDEKELETRRARAVISGPTLAVR